METGVQQDNGGLAEGEELTARVILVDARTQGMLAHLDQEELEPVLEEISNRTPPPPAKRYGLDQGTLLL